MNVAQIAEHRRRRRVEPSAVRVAAGGGLLGADGTLSALGVAVVVGAVALLIFFHRSR
jgi:hypothetical protein